MRATWHGFIQASERAFVGSTQSAQGTTVHFGIGTPKTINTWTIPANFALTAPGSQYAKEIDGTATRRNGPCSGNGSLFVETTF